MRLVTLFLLAPTALATAADHPCDAAFPDACVDPSATIGTNATLSEAVRIGPNIQLDDVVIQRGAILDGRDDGATTQFIGDGTVIGRQVSVGSDATIGTDVTLTRNVSIGDDLIAGNGATVGYASQLGDGVSLGTNAVVGALSTVGDDVTIDGIVSRSVQIGANSVVDGIVGPEASIGEGSTVSGRVRKGAQLSAGVTVESGARVGRGAELGYGVVVEDGATVRADAVVPACGLLSSGDRVTRGMSWDGPTAPGCVDPDAFQPYELLPTTSGEVKVFDVATNISNGDVYVVGTLLGSAEIQDITLTSSNAEDLFVAAFEGDGTLMWARSYPDGGEVQGDEITYYSGSLYIGGRVDTQLTLAGTSMTNTDAKEDMFVARLAANNGDPTWARHIRTNSGSNSNIIRDVEVNPSGVYLVGTYNHTADFLGSGGSSLTGAHPAGNGDGFYARISHSGTWQRLRTFGAGGVDSLYSITTLPTGNMAIGGAFNGTLASGSTSLLAGPTASDSRDAILVIVNTSGTAVDHYVIEGGGSNALHRVHASGSAIVGHVSYANSLTFGSTTITGGSNWAPAVVQFNMSANPVRAYAIAGDTFTRPGNIYTDGSRAYLTGYTVGSNGLTFGTMAHSGSFGFAAAVNLSTGVWEWSNSTSSTGGSAQMYAMEPRTYNGVDQLVVGGWLRSATQVGSRTLNTDDKEAGFWIPVGLDGSW